MSVVTADRVLTRFAPSPTGYLHLGHAYSALFAKARGTDFLLRIEDIDQTRCKPEYIDAIFQDLEWLGLDWPKPVRRQSEHLADYQAQLTRLEEMGVIYPCFCTRSDIAHEIAMAQNAPHGPDGPLYPRLCADLSPDQRAARAHLPHALRLDVKKAQSMVGSLRWHNGEQGWQMARPEIFGDVVLARKDTPTSYHLSVVTDDALQGIDLVTRGVDLFEATHIHVLLQALLGLPTPKYWHHALQKDEQGRRYAKRDQALTLRALRESGVSVSQIHQRLGL